MSNWKSVHGLAVVVDSRGDRLLLAREFVSLDSVLPFGEHGHEWRSLSLVGKSWHETSDWVSLRFAGMPFRKKVASRLSMSIVFAEARAEHWRANDDRSLVGLTRHYDPLCPL